jgi:multiple RNA-binding domain-containing protein 1
LCIEVSGTLSEVQAGTGIGTNAVQGAGRAFKRLAYKRFLHVPLYLEYAPEDVFDETFEHRKAEKAGKAKSAPLTDADLVNPDPAPANTLKTPSSHVAPSATLFIKDISFETSRASLEKHCKKAAAAVGGVLRSVALPSKKPASNKKQAGGELLQGFAFAEFGDQQSAEAALKHLHGSVLDGHKLQVEFSRGETGTSQKGAAVRSYFH